VRARTGVEGDIVLSITNAAAGVAVEGRCICSPGEHTVESRGKGGSFIILRLATHQAQEAGVWNQLKARQAMGYSSPNLRSVILWLAELQQSVCLFQTDAS
jgi:hypothetical protein